MKKLFTSLLLTGAVLLTGCANSVNSAGVKTKLESNQYSVEIMSKAETEVRVKGINFNVTITDAIYATKGPVEAYEDVFLVFFCANADDADSFMKENLSALYYYAASFTKEPKVGVYNNCTYTGSEAGVNAAGFTIAK